MTGNLTFLSERRDETQAIGEAVRDTSSPNGHTNGLRDLTAVFCRYSQEEYCLLFHHRLHNYTNITISTS